MHPVGVTDADRAQYRRVIDRLVHACRTGQGQIGPDRARRGVWNTEAKRRPDDMPDQQRINVFLPSLNEAGRDVLAEMLSEAFVGGVHQALVVLHGEQVTPFEDGYEGTPFHDFAGRLDDWPWPNRSGPAPSPS